MGVKTEFGVCLIFPVSFSLTSSRRPAMDFQELSVPVCAWHADRWQ